MVKDITPEDIAAFVREDLARVIPVQATEKTVEKVGRFFERTGKFRMVQA